MANSEDVLHQYAARLLAGGSSRQDDAALMERLAAEVRELRRDRARLDAILARRKVAAWNEELGYSVELENREMVDAWLEDLGGGEGEA